MGTFSIWHWVVVLAVALLLFGRGRIPGLMGDLAQGLKAFRYGMTDTGTTAPIAAPSARPAEAGKAAATLPES